MGRAVGLDELRVDWLLGDPRWGSRIGELTYMGAGSRVTPPLSRRLSMAYAAGHLCRLGLLTIRRVECDIDLQVAADSHPPSCLSRRGAGYGSSGPCAESSGCRWGAACA